jgi:DNA (cytosine-5)-methyltransferase 1
VSAYYNEIDPFAAEWLRSLIKGGHIADGIVDERSIEDIQPDELREFTQCHFFAGIGGWSFALRLAGWPDRLAAWTGSCPCQPFSVIGKQGGVEDERHLWPEFGRLIAQCDPPIVFGEQVASKAGRDWLAGVRTDLEALGYAVGAADLCAAGVGAPHVRQRIFWVGYADDSRLEGHAGDERAARRSGSTRPVASSSCAVPWDNFMPITDRLGNARRCEPGLGPMAPRLSSHMGLLRAYGNAIVPQVAAQFIAAFQEAT